MATSGASEPRRKMIGEWEVMHRIADPDREVYSAERIGAPDERAILVIVQAHGDALAQLRHEMDRCRALDHPAIARVFGFFEDDGRQVIAFEHLEGTSLHRLMKYFAEKNEGLGDRAVLHVGVLMLEALCAAHQARTDDGKVAPIVHGQLGPHQVLISWEGDVKLMGLGLSAAFGGAQDEPEWLVPFAAPEVRRGGPLTARANVYTAGAMLWSLFARQPLPEDGSKPEALRRLRPDLPAAITFPIDRALEPESKRISAKALAVSLARTLEEADREELRWAMEVCRVRCTVDEEFLPQESFPQKRARSLRAVNSSSPPDSDRPTEKFESTSLLAQARIIGPLPWDPPPPVIEDDSPLLDEPGGPTEGRIPRPSKSRRMLSSSARRVRRGHGGEPVEADSSSAAAIEQPVSAEPSTSPRKRMNTKVGLADLAQTMVTDEERPTVAAPSRYEKREAPPIPRPEPAHAHGRSEPPPASHDPWREQRHAELAQQAAAQQMAHHAQPPAPSSTAAPASQAPSPSQAPHPAYVPVYAHPLSQYPLSQGVPVTYAPIHPSYAAFPAGPASQMAPAPTPPNRWVAVVAVTAVASFAAGMLLASGGVSMSVSEVDVARSSVMPPAAVAPAPVPQASVAVQPSAEPSAPPVASSAPSAEPPEPELPPTVLPESIAEEAAELPANLGILYVHTSARRAYVYVAGRMMGPANQALEVSCGPHHVRLADEDGSFWHDPGQSISIGCRMLTEAVMEPKPAPPPQRRLPWPPAQPKTRRKGQFF